MTIADICLFVAAVLYLAPADLTMRNWRFEQERARDLDADRCDCRPGWRGQASMFNQNGLETFALFAVAVILAEFRDVPQIWIDRLAAVFVVLKLGHVGAHPDARPLLRTMLWAVCLVICVALFLSPMLGMIDIPPVSDFSD